MPSALLQNWYNILGIVVVVGGVLIKWLRHEINSSITPTNTLLYEIRDNHLKHLADDLTEVKGDVKELQSRTDRLEDVLPLASAPKPRA